MAEKNQRLFPDPNKRNESMPDAEFNIPLVGASAAEAAKRISSLLDSSGKPIKISSPEQMQQIVRDAIQLAQEMLVLQSQLEKHRKELFDFVEARLGPPGDERKN